MRIDEVEGIGPAHGQKLADVGVATTEALLERGASSAGRSALAEATGISGTLILEWVNHVDLMRLDGVGPEYSDLLEAAGVDSPAELAQRNAANLATTFQEVVAARPGIVRRIPTEAEVSGWIAQAKTLPKVVTHGGGGSTTAGRPATEPPAMEPPAAEPPAMEPPATAAPAAAAPAIERPPMTAGMATGGATEPERAASAAASTGRGLAGEARSTGEGWWARIKRLFGG